MKEQKKRSIAKTLTWRITASLDTFVIAWVITGDWKMGGSIAGIEVLTKMFFYYFHERIWSKIKWGTKKKILQIRMLNKNIQKIKLRKNKRVKDGKKATERERALPRNR